MAEFSLAALTAKEQAALVRQRKVSPVEIVESCLGRIESANEKLNSFLTVAGDEAMQAARRLERAMAKGRKAGPLAGVPVGLKDCIETKGIRTTAGSRALEHHVPAYDATLVRKLKEADAIVIGKTHLSEAATAPTVFGDMRNPWDTKRLAGASSGGSASAVAASMCGVAIGTDTGASVRMPAAYSGIVGLKPTFGRISRHGIYPLSWSLDHAGPMTRTVEDTAIALAVVSGLDPLDIWSADAPVGNYQRALARGVKGLRMGIPKEWFFDLVEPETLGAVEKGIRALKGLGMASRHVSIPLVTTSIENSHTLRVVEAGVSLGPMVDKDPEKYGKVVRDSIATGRATAATAYAAAQEYRQKLRCQLRDAFASVDVIITPTTPMAAPLLTEFLYDTDYKVNGKSVPLGYALAGFAHLCNLTGYPAVSIPCGFTSNGLPIGMQIIGKPFDEAMVLRVAHAFEQSTPHHTKRPPV